MQLLIKAENPTTLKNDIIELIESRGIKTWQIHLETKDKYLKHTKQWGNKAVIKLFSNDIQKVLNVQVIKFKNVNENVEDFEGYYFGRFCELIFVNFLDRFTTIYKE